MQLHSSETLINSRYQLHQILGQGGMGAVYLCTDRMTDTKLALKRVLTTIPSANTTLPISPDAPPMLTAQFEEEHSEGVIRLALSQEFETLASLRHPNIISVLDYGFDEQKQPFFTMPLLQDALTITEAAKNQSLPRKVQLIGEMLQALSYLHHRGIVHRDLKPDNVLVASDMRVKVLDFGLAILRERQDVDDDQVSGTIPYMAPEVLRGESANPTADIFAAGLIAYEILAGHYPFSDKNVSQIIMAILIESPDFDELDISQELRITLEQMLERDSNARLPDAYTTFSRLREAEESKLLLESEEVRESYLQAARFVGRDKELRILDSSLLDATKGYGSSWLIGGESGVGKSRLIDELRVRALVSGVTVLRGQAASGEGLAFQVWREPIRRLLLMSNLDDQECSILKALIPDIERLLQRPIPDVETRGSTTYLDQLNTVIVKLFRSQNQPILLILEDLQWTAESLDVLDMLNTIVGHLRLLIVGTYQDDERASLPEKLPSMNLMKLERFSKENIKELSGTFLGGEQQTDLVDLLFKETEGNVQFVIEVIRTLAQEAGDFYQISSMELPKEVTAGGIQLILQRRLENLEDADFSLLRACAFIGREINEALLTQLIQKQGQVYNIEDWLAKCLNRGIFDLHNGTWRFSHDRLRTSVTQDLDSKETVKLHEQIALVIEQVYPDAPEHYAKLQYHWSQADNRSLELKYAIAAGDYAMKLNMFMDARKHYERAYELLNVLDNATTTAFSAEILLKLGEAQYHTSHFEESQENLENALVLLNKDKRPLEVAQAYYFLANTLWRQSDYDAARIAGQNSLEIATKYQDDRLMAVALTRLGQIAYEQGDITTSRQFYDQGLIHAMDSGDGEAQAALYNNIGLIQVQSGNYEESLPYFEQSIEISRERGAQHRVVSTLQNLGAVAGMREDFDKSLNYFEQSLELARNIGDRRAVSQILGNLGFLSKLMKDFERAREYLLDSLKLAQSIGNRRNVAAAYKNLGEVEFEVGDLPQSQGYFIDCLREAYEIDALPFVMDSLLELALIEDNQDMALIWLEKVFSHSATRKETFGKAEALIEALRQTLGEDVVEAQLQVGASMELRAVVEAVLNHISPDKD